MNEHHEPTSNPYEDESQVPYASWEENKVTDQEVKAAATLTPQNTAATQGQASPAASLPPPQWYGYASGTAPVASAQSVAIPKQDGYLQGLAITTIICSALLLIIGLVGAPITIITFFSGYYSISPASSSDFFSRLALYLTGTAICLFGGGFSLYHSIRSVLKRPSATVILPSFWVFLIPYVIAVGGLFAIEIAGGEILLVLLVLLLLLVVSPLVGAAFIALGLRLLPVSASSLTWRRLTVSLVSGATAPFFLAALLFVFVNTGLLYAIYNCSSANPASYCTNGDQIFTATFILIAVIGPIILVTITPLLLAFYIRKVQKAGEALLLGLACGIGFGIMEGAFLVGNVYHNWIGILFISFGLIALNGSSSGLVALGWYHTLNPDRRHLLKAAGYWSWAVVEQIIVYLLAITGIVIGPVASFLSAWKFSLGTGIVSLYEIGYIVGIIVVVGLFLYVMRRIRKEEAPSTSSALPSTEVAPPPEVSSDVSEMSSDV